MSPVNVEKCFKRKKKEIKKRKTQYRFSEFLNENGKNIKSSQIKKKKGFRKGRYKRMRRVLKKKSQCTRGNYKIREKYFPFFSLSFTSLIEWNFFFL